MSTDKKIKVCLLGATFDTDNMGVGALTAGVIKSTLHQFPNAEIYLLNYGKKGEVTDFKINIGKNYSVKQFNMRFSKKIYLKNNIVPLLALSLIYRFIPIKTIRDRIVMGNIHLRQLNDADIVASIAGGDSFSDIYGLERFFYVSLPQLLAIFMKRNLVLLPQTLGPFKSRIATVVARYIMNNATLVYSRDQESIKEAGKLIGNDPSGNKLRFCYDVGFIIDPIKPKNIDLGGLSVDDKSHQIIVGLNVSGLLFMGGYKKDNTFGLNIDYKKFIYALIDDFITRKNATILLVPHVFGGPDNIESDSVVCGQIFEELKNKYKNKIYYVHGTYDQNEIKYIIGLCDFFIGSRMHSCIAALSQSIPTIAVAYSRKFSGVWDSIGLSDLVADPRTMDKEEIFGIIDKGFKQREAIKARLVEVISGVKKRILNLFDDFALKDC